MQIYIHNIMYIYIYNDIYIHIYWVSVSCILFFLRCQDCINASGPRFKVHSLHLRQASAGTKVQGPRSSCLHLQLLASVRS